MKKRGLLGVSLVWVVCSCGGSASESGGTNGAGASGRTSGGAGVMNGGAGANARAGAGSGGKNAVAGSGPSTGGRAGDGHAGDVDDPAGAGGEEQAGAAGSAPDGPQPTCNDHIKNQTESDTDCGGVCTDTPCDLAAACNVAGDCASYVCTNKKCVADLVVAPGDVIDDFEDGDVSLPVPAADHGNRVGSWTIFDDGSGGANSGEVVAMKRGTSAKVLHTTGVGFQSWGSGFQVDFDSDGATKKPYDASRYSAITFWARADKTSTFTVSLPDIDTDSTVAGHSCTTCDHHFLKVISVGTDWQRFTLPFSGFKVEPGTVPTPLALSTSNLVSLQFLKATAASVTESYDLWIDDVAFLP